MDELASVLTAQAHRPPQRRTGLDVVTAQPAGASTGRDQVPRLTWSEEDVRPLAAQAKGFIFEALQARCNNLTSDEEAARIRQWYTLGSTIHSSIRHWDYHNELFQESYAQEKFVPTAMNLYEALCKAHAQNLFPNLNPNRKFKVVDLGCGPGSGIIAVEAFRRKLRLKSVKYMAVDKADWTLQLTASSQNAYMHVQIHESDLTKMNEDIWRNTSELADANLVICSYVHDVLEYMLTIDFLTEVVAKGACLLYVCPDHRCWQLHCPTTRLTDLGCMRYCNQRATVVSKIVQDTPSVYMWTSKQVTMRLNNSSK